MAKYKLTVKCKNACELCLISSTKDLILKEFKYYMASFLSDNFEVNFNKAVSKNSNKTIKKTAKNNENEQKTSGKKCNEKIICIKENNKQEKEIECEAETSPNQLTLKDYAKNKNINNTLDEFVTGACYLEEILDIKEFTLKQLNSKLYPVFKRLADLNVIDHARQRVLIETKEENGITLYSINQNAWNYHNYDLVRH